MLVDLPARCFTSVWHIGEEGTMTVRFGHEKLHAYQVALEMVAWVEAQLSDMELTVAARDHLRRASESIVRNIVRANSKHTPACQRATSLRIAK
jgi:hypothetical protein